LIWNGRWCSVLCLAESEDSLFPSGHFLRGLLIKGSGDNFGGFGGGDVGVICFDFKVLQGKFGVCGV
jgi:hypothetical protein